MTITLIRKELKMCKNDELIDEGGLVQELSGLIGAGPEIHPNPHRIIINIIMNHIGEGPIATVIDDILESYEEYTEDLE